MWFSGKGTLNEYYIQDNYLVVNPWADSTTGDYNENNAGILYSDINAYLENADVGLYDFVKDYSDIINSIDASVRALAKNCKVIGFITGASNSLVNSAKQMVNSLLNSDNCIGICEESLVDSIKVNPISTHMDYKFSELIKTRQYYISDFYQKLGIASNQNMKAERLTDNESQLVENTADVDFDHIIDNLNYSVKFINEKFGLNISFRLNEKEDDEVVNNSEENEQYDRDTAIGTETVEGTSEEVSQSDTRDSSSDNISAENTGQSDRLREAVVTAIAELVASKLKVGEDNGRESGNSDVRGDGQSEVQGLPVSSVEHDISVSSDKEEETETGVVNNSETEEKSDTEVEVDVTVKINEDNDEDMDNKKTEDNSEEEESEEDA